MDGLNDDAVDFVETYDGEDKIRTVYQRQQHIAYGVSVFTGYDTVVRYDRKSRLYGRGSSAQGKRT